MSYAFPPISLLNTSINKVKVSEIGRITQEDSTIITDLLGKLGVDGSIVNTSVGVNYVQYEWRLREGDSISKLKRLKDELSVALGVHHIELEIPVRGKNTVGITVPRALKTKYLLREALENEAFSALRGDLNFVVGCDFRGEPVYGDLAVMPNMIIGGATGSGKSVFIDSMLVSMMYKYTPNDVKFILVDTNRVNFRAYQNSPFLFGNIITDVDSVFAVFDYLLREMKRRYEIMANAAVRNIQEYNLTYGSGRMHRIVVVIDDVADIMLTHEKDMIESVQNMTLLARAAGIHFVFSTQSPNSKVLTGALCANFISRAAFSVAETSQSLVILGEGGAEKLIGNGDMLYFQTGYYSPKRVQGAYVSIKEINNVIDFQVKH